MLKTENSKLAEKTMWPRLPLRVFMEDQTNEQLACLYSQAIREIRRRGMTTEDIARICGEGPEKFLDSK